MKKQRRRWLGALLVVVMLAVCVFTDAGVMTGVTAQAATGNAITRISIANLPEDGVLRLEDETYDFESKILKKEDSKKKSTGVVYWEVKRETDTAGVQSSYTGVVYPVMAGEFEIRVLAFRTKSDRTKWLDARKANGNVADPKAEKYVTASSDWAKITVTSEEEGIAIARTQYRLNKLLKNKDVSHIVIRTDSERDFTIGSKQYLTKTLTVNAPNSEVTNAGRFAQINVEQIKESTFHEKAKGNKFYVTAPNARLVVEKNARVAGLSFAPDMRKNPGAKMDVIVEGTIQNFKVEPKNQGTVVTEDMIPNVTLNAGANASVYGVTVSAASNVSIVGENQASTKVTVEETAKGTTLNAQTPVRAELKASVEVVLGKAAKKSVLNILKAIEMLLAGEAENATIKVDKEAEGAKVKTEVKVEVQVSANVSLELGEGSEGSSVVVKDTEVKVEIENNTKEDVEIKDNAGNVTGTVGSGSDEQVTVTPTPQPTTPDTGSNGGTTTTPSTPTTPTPTPTPTPEDPTPTPGPDEPGEETPAFSGTVSYIIGEGEATAVKFGEDNTAAVELAKGTEGKITITTDADSTLYTVDVVYDPANALISAGNTVTAIITVTANDTTANKVVYKVTFTVAEDTEPGPDEPTTIPATIAANVTVVTGSAVTTVSGAAITITTKDVQVAGNGTAQVTVSVPSISSGKCSVQVAFTATATGSDGATMEGVTFKWYKDDTLISGVDTASYTATLTFASGTSPVVYRVEAVKAADSGTTPNQ